jgi:hypothetical protein
MAGLALVSAVQGHAQGTFQNLDFESATLSPIPPGQYGGEVPISEALPGWTGSVNGTPVTQVLQNNITLGAPGIDILGPAWNDIGPGILDGSYTVFLQDFFPSEGNVSLYQDGTVPANTASLQFSAWSQYSPVNLLVSFAGNNLSLVALSTGTSPSGQPYTVYGASLAPYAGQTGQLEFTTFAATRPGQIELDDISFSTQSVPEASPLLLTGLGGTFFALYRRFAPKRCSRL